MGEFAKVAHRWAHWIVRESQLQEAKDPNAQNIRLTARGQAAHELTSLSSLPVSDEADRVALAILAASDWIGGPRRAELHKCIAAHRSVLEDITKNPPKS